MWLLFKQLRDEIVEKNNKIWNLMEEQNMTTLQILKIVNIWENWPWT
jgi:hypothetical protein